MTHDSRRSSHASLIEALLFLAGDPIDPLELQGSSALSQEEISTALDELEDRLVEQGSGLRLLRAAEGVQLITAPEYAGTVEAFLKAGMREELTPAASETLAIIAYRGPIARAGIEAIRGVNSSFTLRLLTIRGLVERTISPADSRVYLYQVSAEFLRHLGLARTESLPDYAALRVHEGMTALEESVTSLASDAEHRKTSEKRSEASPKAP